MTKYTYMSTTYKSQNKRFGIKTEKSSGPYGNQVSKVFGPTGSIPLESIDDAKELRDFLTEYIEEKGKKDV